MKAIHVVAAAILFAPHSASPQATIRVGDYPNGVAVNAATNKVYVARAGALVEIDPVARSLTNIVLSLDPLDIAVNPVTNKVYIANSAGDVVVVDGATLMNGQNVASAAPVYQEANTAWRILGPLEYAQ